MRGRYALWLLIILLLLFLGSLCYLQSGKTIIALEWLNGAFPSAHEWLIASARRLPMIFQSGWVEYHLADIMWAGSCAMVITGIWVNHVTLLKLLLLGMACAIFYEVLQMIGFNEGTFDYLDMIYSLISGAVATLLTYLLLIKKDDNNEETFELLRD